MPKVKTLREDASRRVTIARCYHFDSFKAYAAVRVDELVGGTCAELVPEWESGGGQDARDAYETARRNYANRRHEVIRELAAVFNVRYLALDDWHDFGRRPRVELDGSELAALRAWEVASRRLAPLRELVHCVRDTPDDDRENIEAVYDAIPNAAKVEARAAVNDFLMAADLMDEVRRLLDRAHTTASALLERHTRTEPLVAAAPIEDYERTRVRRPLIDRSPGRWPSKVQLDNESRGAA